MQDYDSASQHGPRGRAGGPDAARGRRSILLGRSGLRRGRILSGADASGSVACQLWRPNAWQARLLAEKLPERRTVLRAHGVSGPVNTLADIWLSSYGDSSGTLTSAAGGATLDVAGNISGAVTAEQSVVASSLGQISANVSSLAANAALQAMFGVVGGGVLGAMYTVVVSYGDVFANVDALLHDAIVITWGSYSGAATARDSASVHAQASVTGTITADHGVALVSGTNVSGTITADEGIDVKAWGN